eukprot:369226-Alexandrium_andersonii.AAC.1
MAPLHGPASRHTASRHTGDEPAASQAARATRAPRGLGSSAVANTHRGARALSIRAWSQQSRAIHTLAHMQAQPSAASA